MSKIINYFPNTFLGNGHHGLAELARKAKKPVDELKDGEFHLFVNKAQTAFKMLSNAGLIAHYKHPENHRINLATIAHLPKYFKGGVVNYTAALKDTIEKDFATWKRGK